MGIFDNLKLLVNGPVKREAKRITKKTTKQQLYRFNQEIINWKAGIDAFEDVYNQSNVDIIRVYNDIFLDSHLSAVVEARISRTTSKNNKIVDKKGEEIPEQTEMLNKPWFREFLRLALESKFFGYSLIQFGNQTDGSFEDVEIVPREYVYQQKKSVRKDPFNSEGLISFIEGEFVPWVIGVGKKNDIGLLTKAAPLIIFKKTALGAWTEFAELFGAPFRMGKTSLRDEELRDNMVDMMNNMGRNAWGVFDHDDNVEFINDSKTDAFEVYDRLIERTNSEVSKLVLGSTMTTDDGSSRSQSEVHEKTTATIHKTDAVFSADVVNDQLIPFLNKYHGFAITGKWIWDDSENTSKTEQFAIDIELSKAGFEIPLEYLTETYGTPLTSKKEVKPEEITNAIKKKILIGPSYDAFILDHACGICNETDEVPDPVWSAVFTEEIIAGVYSGKYTVGQLPDSLYQDLAERLTGGMFEGLKEAKKLESIPNPDFVNSLRDNAFKFSGAKTFQQVKEMSDFIVDENGVKRTFKQYKEFAGKTFGQFNVNWLKTEINQATGSAQMAEKWRQIEEEKEILPFLKYTTVKDGRVREAHKSLDGVIKPVDSPFWDEYYPKNGWNCRCSVQQLDEAIETPDNEVKLPEVADYMKINSGKQKVLFSPEHPYFIVEDQFKDDKANNFGLKMPKKIVGGKKVKLEGFEGLHTYGTLKGVKLANQKDLEKVVGYKIPDKLIEYSPDGLRYGGAKEINYNKSTETVNLGKGSARENESNVGKYQFLAHELGHAIHYNTKQIDYSVSFRGKKPIYKVQKSEEFSSLFSLAKQEIKEAGSEGLSVGSKLAGKHLKIKTGKEAGDVKELFTGWRDSMGDLTKGEIGRGHTKKYYKERNGIEFFAHLSENYFIGNPYFEAVLPKTYKAGNEYFKKLLND